MEEVRENGEEERQWERERETEMGRGPAHMCSLVFLLVGLGFHLYDFI